MTDAEVRAYVRELVEEFKAETLGPVVKERAELRAVLAHYVRTFGPLAVHEECLRVQAGQDQGLRVYRDSVRRTVVYFVGLEAQNQGGGSRQWIV